MQKALPLLPEAQAPPAPTYNLLLAQVVARIRPLSEREIAAGDTAITQVSVEDPNSAVVRGRSKTRTVLSVLCYLTHSFLFIHIAVQVRLPQGRVRFDRAPFVSARTRTSDQGHSSGWACR